MADNNITIPAATEPAATLILLRDGSAGSEVLMQVRHRDIAFAGGALVFPGGKLERGDRDQELHALVDGDNDALRHARIAAIRETFEECGLMLARAEGEAALIDGRRLRQLSVDRQRLNRGESHLISLLRRESLRLAGDRLVHFAHWVTPDFMPRRFDTHFFLAQAPESQQEAHDGQESVESAWLRPEEALSAAAQGRFKMLFPTRSILHRLCGGHSPAEQLRLAAATPVVTVAPRLVRRDTGTFVQIPDTIGYALCEEKINRD